jgi:hypothetical protein
VVRVAPARRGSADDGFFPAKLVAVKATMGRDFWPPSGSSLPIGSREYQHVQLQKPRHKLNFSSSALGCWASFIYTVVILELLVSQHQGDKFIGNTTQFVRVPRIPTFFSDRPSSHEASLTLKGNIQYEGLSPFTKVALLL